MAAIQLNFALRTSANCKTVHLLGSWDNYAGQLPLSKDTSKSGSWKGAFRFQSSLITQGQRYWYYYILDGYHVSHDPAREHTVEPTTGRKLNTLDVPVSSATTTVKSSRHSRTSSSSVAKGRPVSPGRIMCPQPFKPGQTKHIIASAETTSLHQISAQLARVQLADSEAGDTSEESDSDADSDVPSLTSSRSSASTSSRSSSVSSSSSCCTCERYGITRAGNRVRLDCGGSRCGYSEGEESSDCGSESENETYRVQQTRRQGDPLSHDHNHRHQHQHGPNAKTKPMLRILTRLNDTKVVCPEQLYPPDDKSGGGGGGGGCRESVDTSATLRRLLRRRYAELAPEQMPPHLESPDAIVPPLTPAMVQYPTIKKRGRPELRPPRQIRSAHTPSQNVPSNGWMPRSEWSWRT